MAWPVLEKQLPFLFPTADLRGKPQRLCQIHAVLLPIRVVARDCKAICKYRERVIFYSSLEDFKMCSWECKIAEVRQRLCLSLILFKLHSKYLTKDALEGFGVFKIGGQVIGTVEYASCATG